MLFPKRESNQWKNCHPTVNRFSPPPQSQNGWASPAAKQRGRAGSFAPARPGTEPSKPGHEDPQAEAFQENAKVTSTNALPSQTHAEGVTVIGEAVRRVSPETAEFLVEITAAASTAAQALH